MQILAVDDDERIGLNFIGKYVETEHGAPYYHVHVRVFFIAKLSVTL